MVLSLPKASSTKFLRPNVESAQSSTSFPVSSSQTVQNLSPNPCQRLSSPPTSRASPGSFCSPTNPGSFGSSLSSTGDLTSLLALVDVRQELRVPGGLQRLLGLEPPCAAGSGLREGLVADDARAARQLGQLLGQEPEKDSRWVKWEDLGENRQLWS